MKQIDAFISPLPPAPDLENPLNFDEMADKFVRAMDPFGKEANALAQQMNELALETDNRAHSALGAINETIKSAIVELEKKGAEISLELNNTKNLSLNELRAKKEELIIKAELEINTLSQNAISQITKHTNEQIQKIIDNGGGNDYQEDSQILAHLISFERVLIEKGVIDYESKKTDDKEIL
ncbi:hypothetical protein [Campylobacter sp. US33a]|uniref:hypothetical protein n=1 Tax=Campylobacter sp. US33a TaxID=2498120 RepID=UPI00106770A6|nr:hypothetical protein [Campylobacter sp. US33a]TEY00361.1 hypothetical protein ELQ16_09265 [Campylobacter sp. US33a]